MNTSYNDLIPQWLKPRTPVRQKDTTVSKAVFLWIPHIFFKMGKILGVEVLHLDLYTLQVILAGICPMYIDSKKGFSYHTRRAYKPHVTCTNFYVKKSTGSYLQAQNSMPKTNKNPSNSPYTNFTGQVDFAVRLVD